MDNSSYRQAEMEINLKEVIWDLLSQWKAVLLVALVMALIVTGAKYANDTRAADAMAQKAAEDEAAATLSEDERINSVLDGLDEEGRQEVLYNVSRQMWVQEQRDYISNSLLMNINPTAVRTLYMNFAIDAEDNDVPALENEYDCFISGQAMIEAIKPVIKADANDRYIGELIWTDETSNYSEENNYEDATFTMQVILLDDTNAEAVKEAINDAFFNKSKELSKSIAPHELKMIGSDEKTGPNMRIINSRGDLINRVANMQNNLGNDLNVLSEEQKKAIDEIAAIKMDAEKKNAEAGEASIAPSATEDANPEEGLTTRLSKKYALFGFILGAMFYAFAYLLYIITRGRVNYASDLENYIGTRLLGMIYQPTDRSGFAKLLHSKLVDKYRYRKLPDADTQFSDAVEAIEAVCIHSDIKDITAFKMTEDDDCFAKVTNLSKVKVNTNYAADGIKDKELLDIKNAIFVVDNKAEASELVTTANLCRDYDTNILGCVFVGQK